jgi:signal transduction histidine kinase
VPVIIALAITFYAQGRLKERTIELQEAKKTAEAANNSKSTFLSNVSHELRTPMHGILSFASFGIKKHATADPEKILDYFQKIRQSGETLLTLLNDLLDLAKLESGKITFKFKPANLNSLIDIVSEEYSALALQKNLTIRCEHLASNEKIILDTDKIRQVLRNLLNNAIKFSPEGGTIDVIPFRKAFDSSFGPRPGRRYSGERIGKYFRQVYSVRQKQGRCWWYWIRIVNLPRDYRRSQRPHLG